MNVMLPLPTSKGPTDKLDRGLGALRTTKGKKTPSDL